MKSREPRMAVLLPARLRMAGEWTDVRIRNVSSRGMLLELSKPPLRGCYLEVARGRQRYTARVAWTDGDLCGVQVREKVQVAALTGAPTPGAVPVTYVASGDGRPAHDRRRGPRVSGRQLQFLFAVLALAIAGTALAHSTFRHLSDVAAQVGGALAAAPEPGFR